MNSYLIFYRCSLLTSIQKVKVHKWILTYRRKLILFLFLFSCRFSRTYPFIYVETCYIIFKLKIWKKELSSLNSKFVFKDLLRLLIKKKLKRKIKWKNHENIIERSREGRKSWNISFLLFGYIIDGKWASFN